MKGWRNWKKSHMVWPTIALYSLYILENQVVFLRTFALHTQVNHLFERSLKAKGNHFFGGEVMEK